MSGHENERLSAYLDGELEPNERARVEAHLAVCPACTARLADLAGVDDATAALPAEAPEGYFDTFPARVVARLSAEPRARPRRLPTWTWAAAAAVLLAVVAPLTLTVRREPSPVRERDGVKAPGPSTAPATAPAFAPPPAALRPEAREAKAVRAPLPPQAPPAEGENAIARRKDAPAESLKREAPQLEAREAVALPESVPAPARQAAPAVAPMTPSSRDEVSASGAALAAPDTEQRLRPPEAKTVRTAAQWRRERDAWSGFATSHPADPRADEARVRAIEAAREAWLAGGDGTDETAFRREARAYLEREDARQKDRVEALLESPRRP